MAAFERAPEAGRADVSQRAEAGDGRALGRYELLGEIARGGAGIVYRARDRATGDVCALKCVRTRGNPHAKPLLEGIEREYQVLRGLTHPRIIRVFDYGVIDDGAYYTMELLEGEDLSRRVPLPWRETCQYLRDIATCLSLLHARRLIHRDLTPTNVKLTGDGHCKLIDFGALAEFGRADYVIGTPPFIAPEVLDVGRLDQRVDLYALGALGYYCLTGRHAYPARRIDALPEAFRTPPPPPSELNPDIPSSLSNLIMALLRKDPLARPLTASEVIARLDVIGDLPPEEQAAQRLLMQSYLAAPRHVGRTRELERFHAAITQATEAHGSAMCIVGRQGVGRTRLLEEVGVRAQLAGAAVLRADASTQHGPYALIRILGHSLLDAAPATARKVGRGYRQLLAAVDPTLAARVLEPFEGRESAPVEPPATPGKPPTQTMCQATQSTSGDSPPQDEHERGQGVGRWLLEVSREQPLVVLVDNLDDADDASLGVLLGLARGASRERLLLVLVEQDRPPAASPLGLGLLRAQCAPVQLEPLSRAEMTELMRSLFGDAPRAERLADWLFSHTSGSPLHCMGLVHELIAQGFIHYENGVWALPSDRPSTLDSNELDDSLAKRLGALSLDAHELAQCLSLAGVDSSLDMLRRLVTPDAVVGAPVLLEELIANNVLQREQHRVSFTSAALRHAVVKRMGAPARRRAHLTLGCTLSELASDADLAMRLEAGWHLIRGGEEMRGADMIAAVARDPVACALHAANLFRLGAPAEAALKVYRAARKSRRERMPLLTALTLAGYYEHYRFADAHGDDALDVVEELSGLGLARRLSPYLGRLLALGVGFGLALIRHYGAPRHTRWGSFYQLLLHVGAVITSVSGVAAIALDADRCERVAASLSPVSVLPRRIAIVGIYEFCQALQHIAREHQAEAFSKFDSLAARFADPDYYILLPRGVHFTYLLACHFARGAFAMMRAHGEAALQSAEVLEHSQLPLYMMIGSQLRYLYHLNRGELAAARVHRDTVEMHAARVGSAWQVELWEPASLLPFYIAADDVVELARIAHRLSEVADEVPSMWRYRELASLAAELHSLRPGLFPRLRGLLAADAPRSYIGWSTAHAGAAILFNQGGDHERAREVTEPVCRAMSDADREYVTIFLLVDLQSAFASAGLGEVDKALSLLDSLLSLYADSNHALALGLVHEARARIAFDAGRRSVYEESAPIAARFLRATGAPTFAARADRLQALDGRATGLVASALQDGHDLKTSSPANDVRLRSARSQL